MKIKETIENLKDLRRNLWISVIGIIGGLSTLFLYATSFNLGVLFIFEIANCSKKIIKLINELKEE